MICIAENSGGKGGVAGGAGANGQGSQVASGAGASDYGYPVIEVTTGMTVSITVQLTKDYNGEVASDLTDIANVIFIARPSMVSYDKEIKINCTYTTDGKVTIPFTPAEVDYNNGVWYAEILCYKSQTEGDPLLTQTYRAYLCIRKGMTGSDDSAHTLTAMDVRMALMDVSAEANELLDDLEFSDVMIMHAIQRCIDEWNETPPELAQQFTAVTFPYREHLTKGAIGYLMQEVAYKYTRNRLQYNAAGFSTDTNDKGPMYTQIAQASRAEWKAFIMAKKTELNQRECFGFVDLPYFG